MTGSIRLGIDVGGTFTDFALVDDERSTLATHKQLTTPHDPSLCVLSGIDHILAREHLELADVAAIVHGTTLITNAVIERKGARTGMLVTQGFIDVLDVGMESRYDLFDLRIEFSEPLVPRYLRAPVAERVRHDGTIEKSLDEQCVREGLRELCEQGNIDALAICYLNSYANAAHEQRSATIAREMYPHLAISTSAEVVPVMREFERWSTTVVNAYAQPLAQRYLGRLQQQLLDSGFAGALLIMTSSGGTVTASQAQTFPVRLIESGPAAGALMSAFVGTEAGHADILSFDMGGTTAKGAIVRDGKPLKRYRMEVARAHEFRAGSGIPLRIPVIDMIEIGAGGGSLACVDELGLLAVGPRSAGADPGPACYAKGGTQPTLTDANLVLGYLVPERFLGGEMPLDVDAATTAMQTEVAARLDIDVTRAAWGTHEVINEDVAKAFRMHASELGFDYRSCTMVAFGGSGPLHALRVARKLGIPRVIFPPAAGVMSAIGMLVTQLSFETVKSERVALSRLDPAGFSAGFADLVEQATGHLANAGVDADAVAVKRRIDMRYVGQGYEVDIELPDDRTEAEVFADLRELFLSRYAEVFSDVALPQPLEIVNWKVEATGPRPAAGLNYGAGLHRETDPLLGTRRIYDPDTQGFIDCPLVDRYALASGTRLAGPVLIQERESTCVVGAAETVWVDPAFNLVAELTNS
jgi:N-methylhydantoinase A